MRRARTRGVSPLELLATLLMLAMVVSATFAVYNTGNRQQRRARFYSHAQTEARYALRRITRCIRSARCVMNPGALGSQSGQASTASQLVLKLPQRGSADIEVRFYSSSGRILMERSADSAAGTQLITGATALTFNYFQTTGGVRTACDGTPSMATEVQITLSVRKGEVVTNVVAYTAIRGRVQGA